MVNITHTSVKNIYILVREAQFQQEFQGEFILSSDQFVGLEVLNGVIAAHLMKPSRLLQIYTKDSCMRFAVIMYPSYLPPCS